MKLFFVLLGFFIANAYALQDGFVYLQDVDPTIKQDIRYAGEHNFVGRPIKGYKSNQCILTKEAASALHNIQKELIKKSLSLKVYDCYRPARSADDFIHWSKEANLQEMKQEFYPNIEKKDLFKLGFVAKKSGHSRGSTIDLTIVPLDTLPSLFYKGQRLTACTATYQKRYRDNSIDMGTGYDCMDEYAHIRNTHINQSARQNRLLLRHYMLQQGFMPYAKEWWHFTLKNEPFPHMYFNFDVE